jgi:hypothetical protein
MKYPRIVRPLTDRDQEIVSQIERDVERLDMKKGTMIIVGMICDDTVPKKWVLERGETESILITVGTYRISPYDANAWSETFADFTVDGRVAGS